MRKTACLLSLALLSACAGNGSRHAAQTEGHSGVLVHERIAGIDHYDWRGGRFASEAALMAAADERLAAEVAAVKPRASSGRRLRVVLPPPPDRELAIDRFYYRLDQARVEALRRSGLFDDVTVEATASRDPGVEGRDFVLFRAGDVWKIKDARDRRLRLLVAPDANAFVAHVENALKDFAGELDWLGVTPVKGGVVYQYQGREYSGLRALKVALDGQRRGDEARLVRASHPLGGRVLVVLPADSRSALSLGGKMPEQSPFAQGLQGFDAFQRHSDRRVGAFVAASGLFDAAEVVTSAAEPDSSSHDWVLWRRPGDAKWLARPRGGRAAELAMPDDPATFADQLHAALTPLR